MVSVVGKFGQNWKIESFPNTQDGFAAAKAAAIKELRSERLVIIDILYDDTSSSAHSVVVCGHTTETGEFLVRDPALPFLGFQVFSEEQLRLIWRSRGFAPINSTMLRPMMSAKTR